MKPLLFSILVTVTLTSSSLAADEPTIEASAVAQHVGETVVVHGTVAEVHQFPLMPKALRRQPSKLRNRSGESHYNSPDAHHALGACLR